MTLTVLVSKQELVQDQTIVELMSLKLSLTLAAEHSVNNLQVFGDSMLVIKWMQNEYTLRNFTLQPLMEEIMDILAGFDEIYFHHIY